MYSDEIVVDYRRVALHHRELIALRNVNLRVAKGEFVYLTGKVGSGKSTLLQSMYAEVPIAAGEARVLDYDLNNIKNKEIPYLRRNVGVVFQNFRLLTDRSVIDNLRFVLDATGWRDATDIQARIEQVLKEVGMLNKGYKFPHELSGGEQQRVVMARAMLNNPRILLADEPTGNLDPETARHIVRRLHDIAASGTAVIMAAHNLTFVEEYPARVVKCENKQLIE